MKKKTWMIFGILAALGLFLTGCGETGAFDEKSEITVVSREDGSGTRGAFIELMGIEEKDSIGNKTDQTTKEAIIAPKTDVMLLNIAQDSYAIGYVSLGSLNDTVKALNVDGAVASSENIKNGSYKVARPFNIAYKENPSELARDFIDFILSKEGQEVVSDSYIAVDDAAPAYDGSIAEGKIVVAGSSSVTPVMEKLKEAYLVVNPGVTIEVQMSDSTAGMTNAIDGICDIGMASRALKDSELAQLESVEIALDGIAVIVNTKNTCDHITAEEIKGVFTGGITQWSELIK